MVTSQDRATRRQLAGLPDLLCLRRNRALFCECKAIDGTLNDAQVAWWERFGALRGTNMDGCIVRHPSDVDRWCDD
jgi:hypothetical protein